MLGEGTSARSLLCEDRQDSRRVAIKELRFEHLENWKYLDLFEREATMLARLEHAGIPKVFDFFQEEGPSASLYIVQEFIEGTSLQERMSVGPMLGQDDAFDLALGMLDVLEYLHGRSPPVIHRDIKPSNILLRTNGDPVLIDFGGVCVGWRPPGIGGSTVVGTFGYMPPEQLVGQGGVTSDLYALGATLLHLVTGRPPSDFPFDSGRIEVPPDLPVREALARLIEALLRPAPRDRPQSAALARRILLASPPPGSGIGAVHPPIPATAVSSGVSTSTSTPTSPAVSASASMPAKVVVSSGYEPRFVDLGEPPRDPAGPFKDVYRNLMHPLFPARRLWSPLNHAAHLASSTFLAVISLGVAPAIYGWGVRKRKRKYEDLFRRGRFTHGVIRSVERRQSPYYAFKFEFEAEGVTYVAFIDYAYEMARHWDHGDAVPVLYDPDDPTRCCFVYR